MDHLINKAAEDFKVQAFYQGGFKEITRRDTLTPSLELAGML